MLTPFHALTNAQLSQVIQVYEESLAAPWEWPSERFRELARDPAAGPIWAMAGLEGDTAAGFIINEYLPGGRLWYVHYFAVRDDLRGQGWGARILNAALPYGEEAAHSHGHAGCIGALLEVETVDGPPPDADREQRMRRQRFYERLGALSTGAQFPRWPWAPPEMPDYDLLLIPGSAWDGKIDAVLRRDLIRSLLVEGYGVPEDAPWLVAALEQHVPRPNGYHLHSSGHPT